MKPTIRKETPSDYREVESLIRESFWNVYRPGCIANDLKRQGYFVDENGCEAFDKNFPPKEKWKLPGQLF